MAQPIRKKIQEEHPNLIKEEDILKRIIEAFCDSLYIMQQNYKDTLIELQSLSTRCCFWVTKHNTNFFTKLVDKNNNTV